MSKDPFKDSTKKTRRAKHDTPLDVAVVEQVDADAGHNILVRILTAQTSGPGHGVPEVVAVTVNQTGDISLPSVGDLVVVARVKGRRPVVIGTLYPTSSDVRDYSVGERHIGSDDGTVFVHGTHVVVPQVSSDPDSPEDGSIWYRTDLDEYRGMEGGTKVSFDTTAV